MITQERLKEVLYYHPESAKQQFGEFARVS